jgi:Mlc titration factor MtfA (ptsG expression regulator)
MWPFRQLRRKRILREALLPERPWLQSLADHPILRGLSQDEARRLRELATLFLHEKIFEPARSLELTETMKVSIAVQSCLPIINLDINWYEGWRTVIVYPGEFVRRREQFDDIGVMHEWEEVISGESWRRGPVILSWADVEASGRGEGYNVVIHEMAHKLDLLNGAVNGFPPLHRNMKPRAWSSAFTAAFDELNARLDAGEETPIDPYAAEEPGEFFAVISEYFFEQPDLVKAEFPAVYEQLSAFYRQDPAARFAPFQRFPKV